MWHMMFIHSGKICCPGPLPVLVAIKVMCPLPKTIKLPNWVKSVSVNLVKFNQTWKTYPLLLWSDSVSGPVCSQELDVGSSVQLPKSLFGLQADYFAWSHPQTFHHDLPSLFVCFLFWFWVFLVLFCFFLRLKDLTSVKQLSLDTLGI